MAYWIDFNTTSNANCKSFYCDYISDIETLPRYGISGVEQGCDTVSHQPCSYGSTCFCIESSEVYILAKDTNEWVKVSLGAATEEGSGDVEFICNITADSFATGSVNNWTSDKTFDELKNAYDSGKKVKVILNNAEECIFAGRESYEFRYVCFNFGNSMGNPSSTVTMRWFNISSSGVLGRVGCITPNS